MGVRSALSGFWRKHWIALALFAALFLSVFLAGLNNAPGLILGWLATAVLMVEFMRPWRKIRRFILLALVSFLGAIILAGIHQEIVTPLVVNAGALDSQGYRIFHDAVSLIIFFICVMGIVIGVMGTIVLGIIRLVLLIRRGRTTGAA
jgi:hypothetical protein